MADKRFYPPAGLGCNEYGDAAAAGNFGGCQPPDQSFTSYSAHYNNHNSGMNSFAPVESTTVAAAAAGQGGASPRCYPNPSASQFLHSDSSPVKSFYAGGAAGSSYVPNTGHPQTSYANATAPKSTKFDPFGYQQQSRSPQNNFHQQQQQRISQNQRQPARQFFDDQHPVRPPLGAPVGFPPSSRQHHHQQPFLPPPAGGGFPPHSQHFHHQQQQQQAGNRHPAPPPPPPFFPLGPPHQSPAGNQMSSTMSNNNFGTGGDIGPPPPPSFMYDAVQANGQVAAMNGTPSEFGDDFGMGNGTMPAQYVLSDELLEKIQNSGKRKALFELQIGLEQVAYDVSNIFDTWAIVIRDRMVGVDPLPEHELNIAAAIFVEMAVVLDESQYNYSRLAQYLCRTIDQFAAKFLLPQLSVFITETNTFLSAQHQRNLVLFLAELYDKLDINGVKSSELAAYLFDQLRNLLKLTPISDAIVNVMVKVLKLVGRFLENDRGPPTMSEFLTEFEHIVHSSDNQLNESVKGKVRSLMELRENKWGVVAETTVPTSTVVTTIIEPDQQLTEDECAFMEENFDALGNSPGGSLYATAFDEDNVEDDYEKFLQATAIQAAEKALEKVSIDEDDEEASIISSPKFSASK